MKASKGAWGQARWQAGGSRVAAYGAAEWQPGGSRVAACGQQSGSLGAAEVAAWAHRGCSLGPTGWVPAVGDCHEMRGLGDELGAISRELDVVGGAAGLTRGDA